MVAPSLDASELEEAIEIALNMWVDADKAMAMLSLAPYLSTELLSKALAMATVFAAEFARLPVFAALAPLLPPNKVTQLVESTRSTSREPERTETLVALQRRLPSALNRAVLKEALAGLRTITEPFTCVQALTAVIPHLSPDERIVVMEQTLTTIRNLPHRYNRTKEIDKLAP